MFVASLGERDAVLRANEACGAQVSDHPRLKRELKTIGAMVRIYCRARHCGADPLCAECRGLMEYAALRLERCHFGTEKPTCVNCPVHCYQREKREQVRAVMRFAGPRMLWQHPILSLRHWIDGFKKAPPLRQLSQP